MRAKPENFRRTSIIRNPIVDRYAISSIPVEYKGCDLCLGCKSCSGYEYGEPETSQELNCDLTKYRLIYVDKDFEDWDELLWKIKVANVLKTNIRLVLDKEPPRSVIYGLVYSPMNIVQMNIDILHTDDYLSWVGYVLSLCENCGVFSILFLNPVVPTIIKTYHVIQIIDNFRNLSSHIAIRFSDFPNLPVIDGYINFNGKAVPIKYLEKTDNGFVCNELYIEKFMSMVKIYTIPRKMSLSVCNTNTDCSGIGVEI